MFWNPIPLCYLSWGLCRGNWVHGSCCFFWTNWTFIQCPIQSSMQDHPVKKNLYLQVCVCMYVFIDLLYVLIFVLRAVKLYFIPLFLSLSPLSLSEDYDRWEGIMSYNFSPCQWHWQSTDLINTVPPAGLWSQLCWKYVLSSSPSTTILLSAETSCTSQRLLITWIAYSYAISMASWLHPACPWVQLSLCQA